MAATETQTPEQAAAIAAFVVAMGAMGEAIAGLDAVGLDAVSALRAIPGETEGSTAFDSLPPALRLLLG